MSTWFTYLWDLLKTNFGIIPALLLLVGIILGFIFPAIEMQTDQPIKEWLPYTLSPDSDTLLMQSMIAILSTVSGVVFSVSMLVIAQASSQFGPRIIRIFANRQITQWTLGAFLGSTLYCLLVLWQIPINESTRSLTPGTVLLGLLAGLTSLLLLIRYIWAVAEMMQVQVVIRAVSHDLNSSIDRLFPKVRDEDIRRKALEQKNERAEQIDFSESGQPVTVNSRGYIQAIAYNDLAHLATEKNFCVQLMVRPGDFLTSADTALYVASQEPIDDGLQSQIAGLFLTGKQRTPRQDVECCIRELVEVAVRALSPGINDPHTAMSCIDYLGASLAELARRGEQQAQFLDEEGKIRILAPRDGFNEAFVVAFNQIRLYGGSNPVVVLALLKAMLRIARATDQPMHREAIRREVETLRSIITETWSHAIDREPAMQWYELVDAALECDADQKQDEDETDAA
ncbi:DUF2254 domain-containing protein [Rubinisphaera margarita]|uniref:DUF2254 domain-containing protein n=1 Tax=Rubinisphaera margarita TaxID=2909586 RepID=UPI001EE7F49A|nr:DUF2254 domain-containing protein [Rubinisphaera margarita]MCG6155119.1 DUF2254 domain-containing protein [Rubinisphaera margarita]